MKQKIAFLLGASGSVGHEILQILLLEPVYQKVVVFVRRPLNREKLSPSSFIDDDLGAQKLIEKLVPEMNPIELLKSVSQTLAEYSGPLRETELMAFSALGVGAKTAELTIDQHRAIDVDLNRAFAQALQSSSRVQYFAFLSAIGANVKAKTSGSGAAGMPRYSRVKGEAEEAVKLHGPSIVSIFRPAMILGSQHTPKILEKIAPLLDCLVPKKYHSIQVQQLALAMVAASLNPPPSSKIYDYTEMKKMFRDVSGRYGAVRGRHSPVSGCSSK